MLNFISTRSVKLYIVTVGLAAMMAITVFSYSAIAQKVEGAGAIAPAARCAAIRKSVEDAGFTARVSVNCDDPKYAKVYSDTIADHPMMNGITGTNDQVVIAARGYMSPITLSPSRNPKPVSIDAGLGVAVNGVPIYDYTSQGTNALDVYDAKGDTLLTGELDYCGGHAGRGDDYHYHVAPKCMMAMMKNKNDPAAIIGWGFDGYPIYGNNNPDGSVIPKGKLDVCNAQPDEVFGMRYHTSVTPPYIIQCLDGNFDMSMAAHVPPLSKLGGGGKITGGKPRGGVQDLKLVYNENGTSQMTYVWQGKTYSFTYKPAAQDKCWDFTEQSFTTEGKVVQSVYCRTGSYVGGPPAGMGGGGMGAEGMGAEGMNAGMGGAGPQ